MKTIFTIAAITATLWAQASGTFSVTEINPQHGSEIFSWMDSSKAVYGAGELSGFTELNGRLFFSAQNDENNTELWATDGTPQNASLVKEINPNGSAGIGNIVKVGNRILFMATDNGTDFDLWSSNGLTSGTMKMAEMNQSGNTALQPQNISTLGNRLIFCSETQLMTTDGTPGGTDSLMQIIQYSQGFGYCELNNKVYFLLPNSNWQQEIWNTDRTVMGTQKVLSPATSSVNLSSVTEMSAFNGKIYLVAAESGQGNELYTFDGNVNGTLQKVTLATTGNSYPSQLTLYNGALYFTASTATSANVFRITSSNPAPQELIPNASISWLQNLTFANNSIYFLGEDQQHIHRIALNNLAYSVTLLGGYTMPNYFWNANGMLVGNGSKVFFAAYDGNTNNQVFFQGDADLQNLSTVMPEGANTAHPFNYTLSCGMADVFDFKVWGSKVIVPANFNNAGRELWIFDAGITSDVEEVKNETSFTVFPNPTQAELFVKTNSNNYCEEQLLITNATGELMLQTTFMGSTSINLSKLAAGNYFATISENGKTISTKKFILNK